MIYTIGHRRNYLKAISESSTKTITKVAGGYAFQTIEEARRRIQEEGKEDVWAIWEMDATWDDTHIAPDGWWSLLNKDAEIIRLVL